MSETEAVVETIVLGIVEDLIQDWGLDLSDPISGNTNLVADLDFASVDIIQLCVAVEEHYERKMGFQDMLMHDGSYVEDLALAEMVRFIAKKLEEGSA